MNQFRSKLAKWSVEHKMVNFRGQEVTGQLVKVTRGRNR